MELRINHVRIKRSRPVPCPKFVADGKYANELLNMDYESANPEHINMTLGTTDTAVITGRWCCSEPDSNVSGWSK